MSVYQHRASVTIAAGSAASATLNVDGGILQQAILRANTGTTVFRASLTDENGLVIVNWGWHEGEVNDMESHPALDGTYTIRVLNASLPDIFSLYLGIKDGR